MSGTYDGYAQLAAAVIGRCVRDLREGTPKERRLAMLDVKCGTLDPWIDMLSETYDVYESIRRSLDDVARECAA